MKRKLIDKKIMAQCVYCIHSESFAGDEKQKLCKFKGVVDPTDKCRRFKYDILKRPPQIAKLGDDYTSEDFQL